LNSTSKGLIEPLEKTIKGWTSTSLRNISSRHILGSIYNRESARVLEYMRRKIIKKEEVLEPREGLKYSLYYSHVQIP